MSNSIAISDFIEANNLRTNRFGDLPSFNCLVTYKSKIGNPSSITMVRLSIHGMEFGNIHIDETNELPLDKYHLSFIPRFNPYSFNQVDNSLTITGESDKMKGRYQVKIKAI